MATFRAEQFSIRVGEEALADLRAQERWLNGFHHFRAEIDGIRVHFVHERARSGRGIPLVLTKVSAMA